MVWIEEWIFDCISYCYIFENSWIDTLDYENLTAPYLKYPFHLSINIAYSLVSNISRTYLINTLLETYSSEYLLLLLQQKLV